MSRNNKPRSRKDDVVLQEIDGEVLIYDLKVDKAFCLNQTSALVWQACDGKRTVAEIGDFVGSQLSSNVSDDIVFLALDQLSGENLVEDWSKPEIVTDGMSRRDAIKKAGLASMIALPIVASLAAPMAIHANSLCVVGGICQCDAAMGAANGEICASTGANACMDTNCRCQRRNQGQGDGDCVV